VHFFEDRFFLDTSALNLQNEGENVQQLWNIQRR
jgi:hypothetical protein